jgi:CBS domain-containing protein
MMKRKHESGILDKLTVKDVLNSTKSTVVVELGADEPLGKAFARFAEANVYAVPVRRGDSYIGLIDATDFAAALVHSFLVVGNRAKKGTAEAKDVSSIRAVHDPAVVSSVLPTVGTPAAAKHAREHFDKLKVADVMGAGAGSTDEAKASPHHWAVISESATIREGLAAIGEARQRRVPVVKDGSSDLVGILTQSELAALLVAELKKAPKDEPLRAVLAQTVADSAIAKNLLQPLLANHRALDAFALMTLHNFNGLAFQAGPDGAFPGNISVKDIRHVLDAGSFANVLRPVDEYVSEIRNQDIDIGWPFIHTSATQTLSECLARMVAAKIHRVYLEKPMRIIALTDILAAIASA